MSAILALNCGSSSLKFAIIRGDDVLVRGTQPDTTVTALLDRLEREGRDVDIAAVGHRLVHGGARYFDPQIVTPALRHALEQLIPWAPEHLPRELAAIDEVARRRPALTQVVCFDTAFHRHLPAQARYFALPAELAERGIVRYGFHGLSYASAMRWLDHKAGPRAQGRVIVAHLGNGASCAAIRQGRSVDTTMGFTPAGGLIMSTRSGDLDPGVLVHLVEHDKLDGAALRELINHKSGLLALGGHADLRELLSRRASDRRAADAIAAYCYRVRMTIGAFAATLGGLDELVFTGGVGEHQPPIRAEICAGLEFLGVKIDPRANAGDFDLISALDADVLVRIAPADEESEIVRAVASVLAAPAAASQRSPVHESS